GAGDLFEGDALLEPDKEYLILVGNTASLGFYQILVPGGIAQIEITSDIQRAKLIDEIRALLGDRAIPIDATPAGTPLGLATSVSPPQNDVTEEATPIASQTFDATPTSSGTPTAPNTPTGLPLGEASPSLPEVPATPWWDHEIESGSRSSAIGPPRGAFGQWFGCVRNQRTIRRQN
ncbi:MAG TPA: hypothetical protein PK819_10470, partial [Thermomicrobiales bacterium]|nr:hypothetical protein [Thermomicrobiales bacterium]